jgi:predicted transcriptional regulator
MENNPMITIDEFMTTEPCTLRDTNTINEARQIMTEKHIRHIPITNSENHVLGLVTQRDILAATEPALNDAKAKTSLSEIMIQNVSVVHPSDSLRQAALYLQEHKYGCLPVVSDDALVGIITDSDFIAIAINLLEQAELTEDVAEIEAGDMMDDMVDNIDLPIVDEAQ